MRYLVVRNWDSFQHYKDRNPPWIKLHRTLIDDYEFSLLPDVSKAHLLMIWLLASQHDGRVPADPRFLQRKLGLTEKVDLEPLLAGGFLRYEQPEEDSEQVASTSASAGASSTLAVNKQNARLEEERREEKNSCANAEAGTSAFSRERSLTSGFDAFWACYPKKRNRGDAEKAWGKLKPDASLQAKILQAVEVAKGRDDWRKDGGQFIPYPASWLNAKGWDDAPTLAIAPLLPASIQFRDSVDAYGRKVVAI